MSEGGAIGGERSFRVLVCFRAIAVCRMMFGPSFLSPSDFAGVL